MAAGRLQVPYYRTVGTIVRVVQGTELYGIREKEPTQETERKLFVERKSTGGRLCAMGSEVPGVMPNECAVKGCAA